MRRSELIGVLFLLFGLLLASVGCSDLGAVTADTPIPALYLYLSLIARQYPVSTEPAPTPTATGAAALTITPTSSEVPTKGLTPTRTPMASDTPGAAALTITPTSSEVPTKGLTPTHTPMASDTPGAAAVTTTPTSSEVPTKGLTPTHTPMASDTPSVTITRAPTDTPTTRPSVTATAVPSEPSVVFGIQMDVGQSSGAAGYALAAAAGARWAKTMVSWAQIEPANTTPASYRWSGSDARLQNAVDAGLDLLVSVMSNPGWAASTSCGPIDLVPISEYTEFLTALVSRYSQPPYNVKYWELYNEPDIKDRGLGADYGGCWGNDGALYAQMLAAADTAIHTVDPEAKILLGSLAYEWWNGDFFNSGIDPSITPGPYEWGTGGNEFPDFLEVVLNNGGGDHFDVISFHDYVVFHPRWDLPDDGSLPGDVAYEPACSGTTDLSTRPQEGDILGKLIYLRKRLMKHNPAYGDKPFAVTEMGRRSDGGQPMLQQSCLGGNVLGSHEQQSRYAVQGNVRAMAAGLELAIWFNLVDFADRGYGLLDTSFNPKPAYWAYKTTTSELEGYHYVKQLSPEETGGYNDVEAYLFENGENRKWVLWTPTKLSGEATRQVSFAADQIRVVPMQKFDAAHPDTEIPGVVQLIGDGEAGDLDGIANGRVVINVSASPLFVQDWP